MELQVCIGGKLVKEQRFDFHKLIIIKNGKRFMELVKNLGLIMREHTMDQA